MPLTRATVTVASRIMLPADAIFAAGVGAAWALQSDTRTQTAALTFLRYWPIQNTGIVLCVLAAAVVVGILSHRRAVAAIALGAGMLVYLVLAGLFLTASLNANASLSACLWPLYIATAHLASMLSLAHDEVTDDAGNHRRDTL